MNYYLPEQDEPPLIRLGLILATSQRRFESRLRHVNRLSWIGRKIIGHQSQRILSIALIAILIPTLNPATPAQAAEVGSAVASPLATKAGFQLDPADTEIDKGKTEVVGFAAKPLVAKTEMGRVEKELKAEQERERARRAEQLRLARIRTQAATTPSTPSSEPAPGKIDNGNHYPYGYCTWWAKEKRPDLPNQLGNAKAWLGNAARLGYSTGKEPKVGAIVVTAESGYGHVGYITAVDGDMITVSDMNMVGWGRISSRTISKFTGVIRGYIY